MAYIARKRWQYNKQSRSLSIVTNRSGILGLLRQYFFFFFFVEMHSPGYDTEVRSVARSLPLQRSVTSVVLRARLDFTVIIVLKECGANSFPVPRQSSHERRTRHGRTRKVLD